MSTITEVTLFDHQHDFLEEVPSLPSPVRACLYFRTGAGKSLTALLGMKKLGYTRALVVAPPSTHAQWVAAGWGEDVAIEVMSHAKFRMKDTKLSKSMPVIMDEFHLLGGQQGQGWRKLATLAKHMSAPLFILSATPNYNDAERCYCVQYILDPNSCKGGYINFLYTHCVTEANPFGQTPNVIGFRHHKDAAEYLASLPGVFHLPDNLVYDIVDVPYREAVAQSLHQLRYNSRLHKMVGSEMEMRHTVRYQGLVGESGAIRPHVLSKITKVLLDAEPGQVLIYCNHATVAKALSYTFNMLHPHALITGDTTKDQKQRLIAEFIGGQHKILIGTASLATGTDGLDRVCDTLLIVDDTDDDALRRQLVGRIMPRGDFVPTTAKQVIRLTPQ